MLDKAHIALLYQKFVVNPEMPDEEVSTLTLEELSFIYAASEGAKKDERLKEIHFPIRQQIIYWAAIEALKKAEAVYLVFTKTPMYPYVDPAGGVWMFSTEEDAQKVADDFKKQQNLELEVRKIENKMLQAMITQLYIIGVERVAVDNYIHPIPLKRADIYPEPEWNKDDARAGQFFNNGKLQLAMIQFFQYIQLNGAMQRQLAAEDTTEEQKQAIKGRLDQSQKVLKLMESRVLSHLVEGTFLIPSIMMKDGQPIPPNQPIEPGSGIVRKVANLVDGNKVTWIPAFTDWAEFAKTYRPNEWGALVGSYDSLVKMASETGIGKIVINARGCSFRIDENMIKSIEEFKVRKAEFDAKRAAEQAGNDTASSKKPVPPTVNKQTQAPAPQAAKTSAKPIYGELDEVPAMLEGALKRTAKALKNINRLWLAERTEGGSKGYLLVVEAKAEAELMAEELKRTSAGYLDGKTMEVRLADSEAMKIIDGIKPFYKKGLFS